MDFTRALNLKIKNFVASLLYSEWGQRLNMKLMMASAMTGKSLSIIAMRFRYHYPNRDSQCNLTDVLTQVHDEMKCHE